jgi:site-specific DNA-methyltransferase (adenine-specific)
MYRRPVVREYRARKFWKASPSIPDVWPESIENRTHPHQKPRKLIRALIEALTELGELIVDPCAGSFVVLQEAIATGRRVMATDLEEAQT